MGFGTQSFVLQLRVDLRPETLAAISDATAEYFCLWPFTQSQMEVLSPLQGLWEAQTSRTSAADWLHEPVSDLPAQETSTGSTCQSLSFAFRWNPTSPDPVGSQPQPGLTVPSSVPSLFAAIKSKHSSQF